MVFQKLIPILGFLAFFLAIDIYAYQVVKSVLPNDGALKRWIPIAYWGFTIFCAFTFTYLRIVGQAHVSRLFLLFAFSTFFIFYFSKLIICIFLLLEDIGRLGVTSFFWVKSKVVTEALPYSPGRSSALAKIAMGVAAIPFFSLIYGMVKGAYKYQVKRIPLVLKNLPKSFEGMKLVQISDRR